MKTIKAALLIILGSLFLATGFAFAGNGAYGSLSGGSPFGTQKDVTPVSAPVAVGATTTTGSAAAVTPAPPPAPTSPGAAIKKWVGDNKKNIAVGAIGAYVGYALVGTMLGACTFGLGFLLVLALAAA